MRLCFIKSNHFIHQMNAETLLKYEDKENYISRNPNPFLWKNHANYQIMRDSRYLFEQSVCADLGCNHGSCTILIHEFDPLHVDGYDLNRNALEVAATTALEYGVANKTNFIQTDLRNIPVEDAQYNTILSFHTIEHIYPQDINDVIKEMYRILKPEGFALVSIPYKNNYPDPCHVAFYDEFSLKQLFESEGFTTKYCFEDNRWEEKGLLTALFQKP